jgi:putative peptidoglycan lipid II flippase
LPRFAEMVARRDWKRLHRTLTSILLWSAAAGMVVSIVLIAGSTQIIRIALERGAFTATDTRIVAKIQMCSLLQLPFLPGVAILMRVLSALRANRVFFPFSCLALVLNVGLNYLLMGRAGVAGIALASSLVQIFLFAALTSLVYWLGPRHFLKEAA